ncbi:hypothetical protein [Anaeromyxobacter oryzae]|uniref:Uncharacterized protein n=1 Tax=Anaeromyxobacter oryzae TaxID=2918170 RepID=A0ABN6MX85_9BACT|nr:hypothetical protein [Anaeromyxobacter oryzae]BDG04402.1 hypothetical protein AMOR_33980 [Anaeromyxobacter oryzae]
MARTDRTARIAASVARSAGAPELVDTLTALEGSALSSLLLEVFRARAARVSPADLLHAAERAVHQPSSADARLLNRFDAAAFGAAAGFEARDLAPVAPLGACAALAGVHPNNVLGALRGAEVLGDPTVPLALEAALRRRDREARRGPPLRLCASARLLRLQPVDAPGFTPHFRLFSLVTAGRDVGEHRFETDALTDHVLVWLRLASTLQRQGFRFRRIEVEISDLEAISALLRAQGVDEDEIRSVAAAHRVGAADAVLAERGVELPSVVDDPRAALGAAHAQLPEEVALRLDRVRERVFPVIAAAYPAVVLRLDLSRLEGLGYYRGLALRIRFHGPAGMLPVADGGVTTWTQALLSDRKERLFVSAIGTELLCKLYRPLG